MKKRNQIKPLSLAFWGNAQAIKDAIANIFFTNFRCSRTTFRIPDLEKNPKYTGTWRLGVTLDKVWKKVHDGATWLSVYKIHSLFSPGYLIIESKKAAPV
nr:hypothetical protein [Allomuricauda sp.]